MDLTDRMIHFFKKNNNNPANTNNCLFIYSLKTKGTEKKKKKIRALGETYTQSKAT